MDFDATRYDTGACDADKPARQLIQLAARYLGPARSDSPTTTILDLGCGPGNTAQMLRGMFPAAQIIGIDIDPEMIRYANEHKAIYGCKFFVQNLEKPLNEWPGEVQNLAEQVDVIFSNYALHWIDDVQTLMATVGKLLKPADKSGDDGGLFVFNLLYCGWLKPYATEERERFLFHLLKYPTEEQFVSKFLWTMKRYPFPWINVEYQQPVSRFPKKFYTESFIQIPIKWYRKFLDKKFTLSDAESRELDQILKRLILKQRTVQNEQNSNNADDDSATIDIRQQLWIFQATTNKRS